MSNGTQAVVSDVRGEAKNRYLVARINDGASDEAVVTCSLVNWTGEHDPQKGQIVILYDIVAFKKGWRANSAEPVRRQ